MACEKHNYPYWGCPHCRKEDDHRRVVEEQAKIQTVELKRQSNINLVALEQQEKILNEQKKISALKEQEFESQRKLNQKLIKIEKEKSKKQIHQSYIDQLNIILPDIENSLQADFILKHYFRFSIAIKMWSDNSISDDFIKKFLIYRANDEYNIIEKSEKLKDAFEKKRAKFRSDLLKIKRNNHDKEATKNEKYNLNLALKLVITIVISLFIIYLIFGLGLISIILTILSFLVGYKTYGILKKGIPTFEDVSTEEVEKQINSMLTKNKWLKDELEFANNLCDAFRNGRVIYMPLLEKWNSESSSFDSISKKFDGTIENIVKYKMSKKL